MMDGYKKGSATAGTVNGAKETELQEDYNTPESEYQGFIIDDDNKAAWAMKQIRFAEKEFERVSKIIEAERFELLQEEQEAVAKRDRQTGYLKQLLAQYAATLPQDAWKATKTQAKYDLVHGELIQKFARRVFKKDDTKVIAWAKANGHADLVETKESLKWAELKKELIAGEPGITATKDGELVDGVETIEEPAEIQIKIKER